MDARPFRPRGNENAPDLHQRHKSTGNLATMASAVAGGLRGPAKRAAFGDVTNLSKQTGHTRDENKIKIHTSNGTTQGHVAVAINKENVNYSKGGFSHPAQRPSSHAPTSRPALENKASDANKKLGRGAQEAAGQGYTKKPVHVVSKASTLSSAQNAPALQPRHHKSQPQLKQKQQPNLRRTQSKQLEKVAPKPDAVETGYKNTNAVSMPLQEEYPYDHAAYLDSLYLPIETGVDLDALQKEEFHEAATKLPEITEEEPVVPVLSEGPAPAMSEAEECWDEEEEDFDDQDQAYTTAHSFRSRDLTAGGATTIVPPRVTARVQRELEEAREEVERNRTDDEIEEELWDVSMVAEYGEEIFEYMRELEVCDKDSRREASELTICVDEDAPRPSLHGHSDRDPVVNAISPYGLACAGAHTVLPASRDPVPHRQLHRSFPFIQDRVYRQASAGRCHRYLRGRQV
ncbi:B-type cyclin [Fusarium solani]